MRYSRRQLVVDVESERALSPLIGRDNELAFLGRLVDGLSHGRPGQAALSGVAGAGRTAVLEHVLAAARTAGAATALASCSPEETEVPLSAVTRLATPLLPSDRFAELVADCLGSDREGAARLLCAVFTELAADRPLALAIDDLNWADAWSLRWFEAMSTGGRTAPILLVASAHAPVTGRQLDLRPLSPAESTEALRQMLGELPEDKITAAVLDVARGRPAVLHDLVTQWVEAGSPTGAEWLAETGRAVTSARAARTRRGLPPSALALLRAMSVSDQLDVTLAGRLAGLPEETVPDALGTLEASGLVVDGCPAEPQLAADVLAELPEDARADLCREAAALAHHGGLGAPAVAELLRAAPPVGEAWARAVLEEAASRWLSQGDVETAAETLRRALAERASPPERAALLIRLASTVVRRDPDHADRLLLQILTEPQLRDLPAAATAADLLLARGDAETVHRAVTAVGPDDDPPSQAVGESTLTALGRLARESASVDPGIPLPPMPWPDHEPGEAAEAGVAAFRLAVRGEDRRWVLDLAERALQAPGDAPFVPRIAACRALLWCGALESAADGLTSVAVVARRQDARAAAAQAFLHRAAVALRAGRPDDARRDLAAADGELPVRYWHAAAVPEFVAAQITSCVQLGRLDQARHLAAQALPRGGANSAAAAFFLHAQAQLALAEDDFETSHVMARECGRVLRSRGWVNPMLAPWRATAGLALCRLGDHEGAAALLAEELALAERWGTGYALEALRDREAADLRRVAPSPRQPSDPPVDRPEVLERTDALSPAEREVALLAARGLANREIAGELAIALRTVELRLTKVYRKLGLKGRAALADHLASPMAGV